MAAVNARIVITLERDMSDADFAQFVNGLTLFIRGQNRIGNVQVTTDTTPVGVLPPYSVLYRMQEGFKLCGKNGETVFCTVNDPAEDRVSSATNEPTVGFRGTSRTRPDGREELIAMTLDKGYEPNRDQGSRNYRGVKQEWLRDPELAPGNDDQQFRKMTEMDPLGFHFHCPIYLHSHPVHVGAVAPEPVMLTAGILRAIMAVASHLGDRHTQQAIGAPAEEGAFTSADDPDTLRMITRMREQDEARAKASE